MNVLMLVVDSLRRDYAYSDRTDTPTLDELRATSVTFDQAISGASWTPPSMSSIFSGVYPHRLGMYDFDASYPEGVEPIFSVLDDAGYEVGSFVFDEDALFRNVPEANVVDNFRDYDRPKEWIGEHADDDFFLFVHHYWVHGPYVPQNSAEAWSEKNAEIRKRLREDYDVAVDECRELYADAVERMSEEWLSGLFEALEEHGVDEETLVVFTGDHGEGWGERYEDPGEIQTNFHMHGKQLYDEHIRVPLVINDPSGDIAGKTVANQVRHVDIVPTLFDRLDLEPQGEWQLDGKSLAPALEGESINNRTAISSATDVDIQRVDTLAVRDSDRKLLWTIPDDEIELYDLEADPGETVDVADERPDDVEELSARAERAYEQLPNGTREVDEGAKERLRDLGYL